MKSKKFHALAVAALLLVVGGWRVVAQDKGNVTIRYEWIEMPTATLWEMLEESPPFKVDAAAFHAKVRGLVETGGAEMVEIARIRTRSGSKVNHANASEIMFPTEYEPPRMNIFIPVASPKVATGRVTPTAFDVRNVGTRVEADPFVHAGVDALDIRSSAELVQLGRWENAQKHQGVPFGYLNPIFYTMRLETSVSAPSGRYVFLGANSPMGKEGRIDRTRKLLLFARGETSEDPPEDLGGFTNVTTVLEWVDVELKTLSAILLKRGSEGDGTALKKEIDGLIKAGDARVREMVVIAGRGSKSKVESVEELLYPTEFEEGLRWPAEAKAPPRTFVEAMERQGEVPTATAFDVRNLGTTVEIEMVHVEQLGLVNLNLDAELSDHDGDVWHVPGRDEKPAKSGVLQPLFTTMRVESAVELSITGAPVLAGVLTPQIRDGERLIPDPKWRTMLFVRAYSDHGQ